MASKDMLNLVRTLQGEINDLQKQVKTLQVTPHLRNASLEDTSIRIRDRAGNITGVFGAQGDGSFGHTVHRSQPPPQLSAPIVTVGEQVGTAQVEWDGGTRWGEDMPAVHGHTEVVALFLGDEAEPLEWPSAEARRVGTIRDRKGGEVLVPLPQPGTWAVGLQGVAADREARGPMSVYTTVEIAPLVDTEAIEAELEEARDRIEQAEQELAAGMADRVAEIEHLREVRIPALQDALTTGLDDVYREAQQYAESQADNAVNQAAANAQSEYDRLQELAERALSRAGDNVLEDPSFEGNHWRDAWNGLGNRLVRTNTAPVRTGGRLLVIEDGDPVDFEFPDIDVELDQSYRMTIWYRTWPSNLPDLSDGESALVFYDSDTGEELAASAPLTTGSTYHRAEVVYTVPEGVQSIRPAIRASWPTGQVLFDDVSVREVGAAAEALRMAEVARQQAEAAHVAAGNAVDTAASAYDAASSKSTVHWSLSAPSGTADNTDDVWWQYELRNGRRVVTGQWFWDNGVWRETEMAEEWLPQVNIGTGTYGDMSGDRLEANTIDVSRMRVGPSNLNPDPGFDTLGQDEAQGWWSATPGLWYRSTTTEAGVSYSTAHILSTNAGDSSTYELYYGGGSSADRVLPVQPGETIKVRFQVLRWAGSGNADPFDVDLQWRAQDGTSAGEAGAKSFAAVANRAWFEGEWTAPSGAAYFGVRFRNAGAAAAARSVFRVSFQRMTGTALLVDGAVKSHSVDTEEFFAAEAVIQKVWTDIVRSRLVESQGIITEDMIATGAITTPKLTVTEELVAQIASFIRIEAGSLASNDIESMRIVSALIESSVIEGRDANGELTYRLDGMDNLLMGRLHAGMDENTGIELDYEQIEVDDDSGGDSGEGDESEDTVNLLTPFLRFHTTHNHRQIPRMWVGPDGNLSLNPGRVGSLPQSATPFRIWGEAQANRFVGVRFQVPTSNPNYPGGMFRDGDRVRLYGRAPDWSHPWGTFTVGQLGPYAPSSGNYRGSIGFSAPAETGTRIPTTSGRMSQGSVQDWRSCTATVGGVTASGFYFSLVSDSTSTNMWVIYNAVWQ